MSLKSLIKEYFVNKENKKYEQLLAQKQVTYPLWLTQMEEVWRSGQTPKEVPEFVVLLFSEGEPAEYALRNIGACFASHPSAEIVYADEDVYENGTFQMPWFKPDWSPDLLESYLYTGSMLAVRMEHFQKIKSFYDKIDPASWEALFADRTGNVYRITDYEAVEKWLHHCVAVGYRKKSAAIAHLPQILFHAHGAKEQEKFFAPSAFLQSRRAALLKGFYENHVLAVPAGTPVVSVIVPSKDNPAVLEQCLQSLAKAADIPCEVIVVDNGSGEENKQKVQALLLNLPQMQGTGEKLTADYLYEPMEFHFSKMCNLGAAKARGELLLFLNDDVTLTEGGISELAVRALRTYTGAVGIRLLYPEGNRIQHAGITSLPMGPVHKLQGLQSDGAYYAKTGSVVGNFLAVTAACLMVEKAKFEAVGGFEDSLAIAFNDVDLCYKLAEQGYYNVCVNDKYAFHHESLSRGADESPEKVRRLLRERDVLFGRHPDYMERDPFYSPHLNHDGLDVRIAPAYQTSRNVCEKPTACARAKAFAKAREDECVMVRVEDVRDGVILGYSVVLGDDNACYEKKLLLQARDDGTVYHLPVVGQYRPDLEENLPDQTNVALGGFWVDVTGAELPAGEYRIGVLAGNRVNGVKLYHFSNRSVAIQ